MAFSPGENGLLPDFNWFGNKNKEPVDLFPDRLSEDDFVSKMHEYAQAIEAPETKLKDFRKTQERSRDGFLDYAEGIDVTTAGFEGYNRALDQANEAENQQLSFGQKVKEGLKGFGSEVISGGLNAIVSGGLSAVAGIALDGIFTLVDSWVNRSENIIEAGQKAKQTIAETTEEYQAQEQLTNKVIDSFDTLRTKGKFDQKTNKNIGLTEEQYAEVINQNNQLAAMFPTLSSTVDEQGNAIVILGNSAEVTADKFKKLNKETRENNLYANTNQSQEATKAIREEIKVLENEGKSLEAQKKLNDDIVKNLSTNGLEDALKSGSYKIDMAKFNGKGKDVEKSLRSALNEVIGTQYETILGDDGVLTFQLFTELDDTQAAEISDMVNSDVGNIIKTAEEASTEASKGLAKNKQEIEQKWEEYKPVLKPYFDNFIEDSDNYDKLTDDTKSRMSSLIDSMDASFMEENFLDDSGNVMSSKIKEFSNDFTSALAKDGVQERLNEYFSFDDNLNSTSFTDYKKQISDLEKQLIKDIPELSKSQLDKASGYGDDLEVFQAKYDEVFKDFGDDASRLSTSDLEIAFDIIANDDFSGTFDQLLDKIALVKEAEFDMFATPLMDEAAVAKETKNAGDAYLQMASDFKSAKEMYDQGLVGTDDFKSIAKYLSPSGADDAANFEENYSKAMRYFTVEDPEKGTKGVTGVQNFLNDLESKGFATLTESIDESGNAIEQWKYNIGDLEDAAQTMGIGFEPFMAMFGRLNDYGFSNNFVSSIEQGEEHIAGLTDELSDAEAHLAELQKPGQYKTEEAEELGLDGTFGNQTAIDAQKAKVDELRNSIIETQDAMGQLLQRSAEDRISETENAKFTIETLAKERQKILNGEGEYAGVEEGTRRSVADQLENEINQWAADYSIKLDAELNVQEPDISKFNGSPVVKQQEEETEPEIDLPDYSTEVYHPSDTIKFKSEIEEPTVPDLTGVVPEVKIPSEIQKPGSPELPEVKQEVVPEINTSEEIIFPGKIIPDIVESNESVDVTVNEVQGTEVDTEDKEATVVYDADTSEPDNYDAPNKSATVNYGVNGAAIAGWTPPTKTGVVNYTAVVSAVSNAASAMRNGFANGTAHVAGTANTPKINGSAFSDGTIGHAYSSGDWSIKKGSNSLVGELGREILVRNGSYQTIGDNGAEFVQTKPGDIIFNHKQTEALLSNGYVTGRGKLIGGNAHADGTAYAGGSGGGSFQGGASSSSSSSSSNSNAVANNTASSAKSAASAAESAAESAEETKEAMDYIEIKLDNLTRRTEKYLTTAENAVSLTGALNNYQSAIKSVQEHGAINWQAEVAYDAKASSVDLDAGIKQKVRDGAIIIEDYDSDVQTKIQEYQKWYDKIVECKDASVELKIQQQEIAQQKLDKIIDYYDSLASIYQGMKSTDEAWMEYRESLGMVRSSIPQKEHLQYEKAQEFNTLHTNEDALAKYQSELDRQVRDGVIKKNSAAWLEAQQQIQEYKTSIIESKTAINDLNEQLRTINFTKFQVAVDKATRWIDKLSSVLNLKEAQGETVTESDYDKQVSANNNAIAKLYTQRNAFAEEQKRFSVNSEKYQDLADQIASADNEILQLLTDNEALKDSIREVRWKPFNDTQEEISFMIDEVDNLINMINSRELVDTDTGVFTDEAYGNIALISQGMDLQGQKIADYREGLEKLDAELKNGNINQDEYNEQSREFIEILQNSVNAIQDYKDSLVDLYITQEEKQNELLQEEIDLRQEALDKKKSYYDYDKQLSAKNKDIQSLEAQIAALNGVSSAAGRAELARLQEQLATAKEEREDIVVEHEHEILSEGYTELSENANKALDELTEAIQTNADLQNKVVSEMLDSLKEKYGTAFTEIAQIIKDSGLVVSDALNNQLNDYQNATDTSNKVDSSQTNPADKDSSSSTSNIDTGKITTGNSTNDKAESIASKPESTVNRKIVSLKLDKSSTTVKVGKTTTVKVKEYLPTDATVKFKWSSSNSSIASVSSGGTITGKKPGSATIACTDTNSGKKATCKVTVSKASSTMVTKTKALSSASTSAKTVGTLGVGAKVSIDGLTTDSKGTKWLKVSKNGNSGWVKSSTVKKYAKGTLDSNDELAEINDGSGDELVFRYNGHDYTNLTKGSKVLTAQQTENLVKLSNMKGAEIIDNLVPGANNTTNVTNRPTTINVNIEAMVGNIEYVDKNALPELEQILKKSYKYTSDHLWNELRKVGIKPR